MKTTALIEKGKDGTYGIFTPDINHTIIGSGNTVEEAKADFNNSVKEMILSYTEIGKEIPAELKSIEFDYQYDLASIFNYYDFINVSKFAEKSGINPSLMRQYKTRRTPISTRQKEKIQNMFHSIGQEFAAVKL